MLVWLYMRLLILKAMVALQIDEQCFINDTPREPRYFRVTSDHRPGLPAPKMMYRGHVESGILSLVESLANKSLKPA